VVSTVSAAEAGLMADTIRAAVPAARARRDRVRMGEPLLVK
jgi:hypothetical protein